MPRAKAASFETTDWMKETLIPNKRFPITNFDAKCQKTLLRWQSSTFGPVRIAHHANLYGWGNSVEKNSRLVVLDRDNNILSELQYSPRRLLDINEVKIHQFRSKVWDKGLGSALLSMLCHLEPGVPKKLATNDVSKPKYSKLGFVPSGPDEYDMRLDHDRLTPQDWVKKKSLLFKGKRKIFIE